MKIILKKKPKNVKIIEGFPGFGLVGTIASEFLLDHLKTELIGKIIFDEAPAVIAIHDKKIVQPLGIYYNKQYNIVILHAIAAAQGHEWQLAEALLDVSNKLTAKEIIALEGVGSPVEADTSRIFSYTSKEVKKLDKLGIKSLKEGIIMGVTGALMVKAEEFPLTCFFAETHSNLPDSKAAAKIIETLDKYLGLKVDYKPLFEQAAKFEDKLQNILKQGDIAQKESEAKKLSYLG